MSTPTHKNLGTLIEQGDSRRRENSESGFRETRIYIAEYDVAVAAQKTYDTIGTGDLAGYLLKSSTVEPLRGMLGKLVDVWQAGGDDADPETNPLPSDEVSVSGTNQSIKTERHPRYVPLAAISGEMDRVDAAIRASSNEARAAISAGLTALGMELVDKVVRGGHEAYYAATLSYSWRTSSYSLPTMYRGGWVEAPGGPLAGYFVGDITWLRISDSLDFTGSFWVLTRTWLGSDRWDTDLYSS